MWLTKWKESKKQFKKLQKKIVKVESISTEKIFKHNLATRKKYPVLLAIIQLYIFFFSSNLTTQSIYLVVVVFEIYFDQLSEISLPR